MRLLIFFFLYVSFNCAHAQRQNLLLEETFDDSIGSWYEKSIYYPYSANVTDLFKRRGKSLKVELHKGDNVRSELGTAPSKAPDEAWYGFSLFFPSDYIRDKSPESIIQWQAYPDLELGEQWRSPPLLLGILEDHYIVDLRTNQAKVTEKDEIAFERFDLGLVVKNQWTDFVFHIKWSYDSTGVIELWKNDKLVGKRVNLPNCYNDILYPYFKCGIYKWDWAGQSNSITTTRKLFIDEVRIGNKKATYSDVCPSKKLLKILKVYNDGSTEEVRNLEETEKSLQEVKVPVVTHFSKKYINFNSRFTNNFVN